MRATFVLAALSAFAITHGAAAETSAGNPATQYLTETNSNGVVTGQPEAATSQAAAVTSQPAVATSQQPAATSQQPAASIPAGLSSPVVSVISGSRTTTLSSVAKSTGLTTSTTSGTSTGSTSSSTSSGSSSSSSSASSSSSTGGAAYITAAPMAVVAGAAMAAFL